MKFGFKTEKQHFIDAELLCSQFYFNHFEKYGEVYDLIEFHKECLKVWYNLNPNDISTPFNAALTLLICKKRTYHIEELKKLGMDFKDAFDAAYNPYH
jgi:hypothetical protein